MSAESITVVISTTNRPALLRTALASVAAQTSVASIARVIVSENASSEASRAVAAEFADRLPIDYVFRAPRLPALAHALALSEALPAAGLVAILHDDDWWTPRHLSDSLARLERHPDAAASYASFYEVTAESSLLQCDSNLMFWFGAGFPAWGESWLLDETAIFFSCLFGTPGRYSTLLAPVTTYRRAAELAYRQGNPFDNDRRLLLELARHGPVAFGPTPAVYIRMHALQDSRTFYNEEQNAHLRATADFLLARAASQSIDIASGLARRLDTCPDPARPALLNALSRPECLDALRAARVAPPSLLSHVAAQTVRPNLRYYIGQLVPPLLGRALRH